MQRFAGPIRAFLLASAVAASLASSNASAEISLAFEGTDANCPSGIATDSAGNVFLTARCSEKAFKITPGGVITEIIDPADPPATD